MQDGVPGGMGGRCPFHGGSDGGSGPCVQPSFSCLEARGCKPCGPGRLEGAEGYAGGREVASEGSVALPEPSRGKQPLCGRTSPLLVAAVDSVQESAQTR